MIKTVVLIVIVVAGGLALAFYVAPSDNGALVTTPPPSADSLPINTGEEPMAGDVIIEGGDAGAPPNTTEAQDLPEVGIAVGDRAADFTLQSFDGSDVTLSSFRGRPVLIDFWAGWCPFCVNELPAIEEAHQRYGNDLVVLGIHRTNTESVSAGASFADERGVTYPLLKDPDGSVYRYYSGGQNFMPVAYYIDRNGIIQNRVLGPKSATKIQSDVDALLAQ